MKNNLRELLDKIYELEGLVHLAIKREENSEDFYHLISKKGTEIENLCKKFNFNHSIKPIIESSAPFDLKEYSLDEDLDNESIQKTSETNYDNSTVKNDSENNKDVKTNDINKGRLVFTINDRFRFRRELFENSDVDFNNTLALMASMDSYDEAEDYFLNEEGFEKSNPVVTDFLEVIKKYFK